MFREDRLRAHESIATPLPNPPPQGGREPSTANGNVATPYAEPEVTLPPMALGEEVVNDYRFLELSLRAHPASFLRADLTRRGIVRNEELRARRSGERVTVSGLVTIRQRPGSANGVIFMTIEDETSVANIIVWPKSFERFRPIILGARYVAVQRTAAAGIRRHPCRRLADRGSDAAAGAPDRGRAADRSRWRAPTRSSARTMRTSTAAPAGAATRRASPRRQSSPIYWQATSTCRRAARRTRRRAAAAVVRSEWRIEVAYYSPLTIRYSLSVRARCRRVRRSPDRPRRCRPGSWSP